MLVYLVSMIVSIILIHVTYGHMGIWHLPAKMHKAIVVVVMPIRKASTLEGK
jgi:hypothetical protein